MKFVKILICFLTIVNFAIGQINNNNQLTDQIRHVAQSEKNAAKKLMGLRRGMAAYGYDVTYYRCVWKVDPAVNYISGSVTMYFQAQKDLSVLPVDLSKPLTVNRVIYKGLAAEFLRTDTSVNIQLSNSIAAGTLDSISIEYEGAPMDGQFATEEHAGTPVMWTLSEPYGSMDWWPCKNVINDKADSLDVFLTYPSKYTGVSNGIIASQTTIGDQTTTHWKHRYPIASYLVAIAVTNYVLQTDEVQLRSGKMPLFNWAYPESKNSFFANTNQLKNALIFFDDKFGDYPFAKEKYGQVQFSWGGGMEHQTCSFVHNTGRFLMAHELAHQWFGDKVTANSWQDIWLQEGFATYLEILERTFTDTIARKGARQGLINSITSAPGGSVWVEDTTRVSRIFSDRLSYEKGAYLAIMLEGILGQETFFRGLRNYLSDPRFAYGNATTNDLKNILEAASGKDLDHFFEQWYKGEGYPSYQVKWYQQKDNSVTVTIGQTTSHPSVPFYQMPLPVVFYGNGKQETIILNNTQPNQSFSFPLSFIADSLVVDPQLWVLSKNNISQKTEAPETALIPSIKVQSATQRNEIVIWLTDMPLGDADIVLFDASGRQVLKYKHTIKSWKETVIIPNVILSKGVYFLKVKGLQIDLSATLLR